MKSHHKKNILGGLPKNGRRGLGKYVDIGGWGLGKKEGGGVFEWDKGGGLIPPMYAMQ